jgi:outer membrane protein OmpA-like peptidoglycan-associated protein
MRKTLLISILMLATLGLLAQDAESYFKKKDYRNAAAYYEREAKTDPCKYLNKAKAHVALQEFDKALESLKHYVAGCQNADRTYASKLSELLLRKEDELIISNIGPVVNSSGVEAVPRIAADGKTLYFKTQDRTGGLGGEDIFFSTRNPDGTWEAPLPLNDLNTTSHEAIYSITADGNVAVLFGNYEGSFGNGDIFYSVLTPGGWSMPCNLGGSINSDGWEAQASLSPDGRTLFFISSRSGGQGGNDIYYSQLMESGWTKPANLGPAINTSGNESRPVIAADGKTLYFASDGHFGFGGKDVFMAKRIGESYTEWTTPRNLGRYFNTLEDDEDLSVTANGVRGYTVKYNDINGFGDYDIYEFVLPLYMRPEDVFTVSGTVLDEKDSAAAVVIRYYDWNTGLEVANTVSRASDGLYRVSLPTFRKYKVVISTKGYLYYSDVLDLSDPSVFLGRQTFNQVLSNETANITRLRGELETYNARLDALINSQSEDVGKSYGELQDLAAAYRSASNELNAAVYRSKYGWLGQERAEKNLVKDYKLQRILIGAKFELKNIQFDLGKATLRPESAKELDKLVDILKTSDIIIELGGHTDNTGDDESNMKLSQDRVNSVRSYLIEKGVAEKRMTAVGYGETMPIATNDTEPGRQQNRRVEVKITEIKAAEGIDIATSQPLAEEPVKASANFDLLPLYQSAALKGGLPKNSPCTTGVQYLHSKTEPLAVVKPVAPTKTPKSIKAPKLDLNHDRIERSDFYFRSFNVHLLDFGTEPTGPFLGAGMTFVGEKLSEFHLEGYKGKTSEFGFTPEVGDMLGGGRIGWIGKWQLTEFTGLPIILGFGTDLYVLAFNDLMDTSNVELKGFFSIPLGISYNLNLGDNIVIGPELYYNLGIGKPSDDYFNNATWLRMGVNARYRFFQGGLFLNVGEVIRYPGFRIGFAF